MDVKVGRRGRIAYQEDAGSMREGASEVMVMDRWTHRLLMRKRKECIVVC